MRATVRIAALILVLWGEPVLAQSMDHTTHGASPAPTSPAAGSCLPEHAAMGHCVLRQTSHSDHGAHTLVETIPEETALAGPTAAPAPPKANYADRIWGAEAMEPVRERMMREHGGMTYSQVMVDQFEIRSGKARDGYAWDAEAWFGGDVDRITVKTEGGGLLGGDVEEAEVQALYSRAIGPYFNLQAGLRQDLGFGPKRSFAVLGLEGLAPYWFEVDGALFLSDKGDLLARAEGYYDQRITQRLILQPRAEATFSAQTMANERDRVRARRNGGGLAPTLRDPPRVRALSWRFVATEIWRNS
ncbi:copper resistance protein B [Novosphingobium sp. JCM 18896]|uniref:copper resistance protein B n=1 Tax=Novosphingobium sp. JCM 18896 TaxID=2989731 RepID=UPI0039B505F1